MSVIDEDGSARRALVEVVRESGAATLDDPGRLGALLSDLLPTTPREATLIVTAANARVAGQLAARISIGMPVGVAVRDVAVALSDTASLDPTRATWVVAEFAHALGYEDTREPPTPVAWPAPPPAMPPPVMSPPPVSPAPTAVYSPPAPWAPPAQPPPVQYPPAQSPPAQYPPAQYPPPYAPLPEPVPRRRGTAGLIAVVAAVLALVAILGGIYEFVSKKNDPTTGPGITGLVSYHGRTPDVLTTTHQDGTISYPMSPPAGGPHNATWEDCDGRVYPAPIPNENAVHSLEHGAVWITFQPGLDADDQAVLAAKVTGQPHMLMSPFPGLTHKVSLQAWGYQLALDDVRDARVDRFIQSFRVTAAPEPEGLCTDGTTKTGSTPSGPD